MADGEKIDAFLYFGHQIGGGPGPRKIDGETTDDIESEITADYGKSMGIRGYTFSGKAHNEGSAEQQKKDMEQARSDPAFDPWEPTVEPMQITKSIDAATPYLLAAMWKRVEYDVAWIVQKKAGGSVKRSGEYFWEILLENVVVETVNWSTDESGAVTETLTLSFQAMTVEYHQQKHSGHVAKQGLNFGRLEIKSSKDTESDGGGGLSDQQLKDKINEFAKLNKLKPLK